MGKVFHKDEVSEQMDDREKMEDEIVDCVLCEIYLILEEMITEDFSIVEEEQEVFELIKQKFKCLFEKFRSSFEEDEEISEKIKGYRFTSAAYRYGLIDLPVFRPFLLSENWTFGVILSSFREVISPTGRMNKGGITEGLDSCEIFLKKMSEAGYGRASYILSRCYGRGVHGIGKNGRGYVIGQNFQKEREYLEKAKGQKNCPMEVYQKLGCQSLRDGSTEQAQRYFEYLSERGIEEGDIYLRYIEHLKHKKEAVESYICLEDSTHEIKQRLRENSLKYKGYLYYYVTKTEKTSSSWKKSENKDLFVKENLSDGSKKFLLEVPHNNDSPTSCFERALFFTIHNDFIYYADENGDISCMDLDGGNKQVLITHGKSDWGNDGYLDMPIAVSKHLFFREGEHFYEYDPATGKRTKICEAAQIIGVSEKEILIDSGKSTHILNLDTYEKKSVQQVYPGLKGKKRQNLIYVDMSLEIAYYIEDNGSCRKSKIVGIDKEGNIADIWHMPGIREKSFVSMGMSRYIERSPFLWEFDYASFSFSGQKLVLFERRSGFSPEDWFMENRDWENRKNPWSQWIGKRETSNGEVWLQSVCVCEFDRMGGNLKEAFVSPITVDLEPFLQ